ncbi:hydroxyisourate hydrolase [candidate division KSB1 bacterium]|nr:hydroxyisourate hydrolase [candidate division KSB1 bacterium]
MKSPITTHVLDTAQGRPASGIAVKLAQRNADGEWQDLAIGETNDDGRIMNLLPPDFHLAAGVYQMTFATENYFRRQGTKGFYPFVSITIEIVQPEQHYHVPLLLSPFGYSTYRGS